MLPNRRSRTAAMMVMGVALTLAPIVQAAISPGSAEAHTWYSSVRVACADSTVRMRCYHNQTRRLAHLPTLARSAALNRSARSKAARIVRCRQHSHYPCGDPFLRSFYAAGYLPAPGAWLVGENLAWGWSGPWTAFAALMRSPEHRANILNPQFAGIGIYRRASPWGWLWVIQFGRRW